MGVFFYSNNLIFGDNLTPQFRCYWKKCCAVISSCAIMCPMKKISFLSPKISSEFSPANLLFYFSIYNIFKVIVKYLKPIFPLFICENWNVKVRKKVFDNFFRWHSLLNESWLNDFVTHIMYVYGDSTV